MKPRMIKWVKRQKRQRKPERHEEQWKERCAG